MVERTPGTIRGDFGMDIGYNMIPDQTQQKPQNLSSDWFPEGLNGGPRYQSWVYEYLIQLQN